MSKTSIKIDPDHDNPFLTEMGEELWRKINSSTTAKPVTKEELLRRIAEIKAKKPPQE